MYDLVAGLVKEGVGASVSREVRETVKAVRDLQDDYRDGVPQHAIARHLKLDKGTISDRVKAAIQGGYLVNDEWRSRQPAKLRVAAPLPDELAVLPSPEELFG